MSALPRQLGRRAVGLNVEGLVEERNAIVDLRLADQGPQVGQLVNLDDLDVTAELGTLLGQVRVDVQHPAIVMAHHAKPIVLHHLGHARGFDPLGDLVPADGVVIEHPRDLVKGDSRPVEDAGNLGHRACRAIGQPLAGHPGPVAHAIELGVIDRWTGLKIKDNHRHPGPAHHRQHRRRQGIGGRVQEDQVNVRLAEHVAGIEGPLRSVDQAKVDDHDAGMLELVLNLLQVTLEPLLQPWELRPVGVQADAEESDLERSHGGRVRGTTTSL